MIAIPANIIKVVVIISGISINKYGFRKERNLLGSPLTYASLGHGFQVYYNKLNILFRQVKITNNIKINQNILN